MLSKSFALTVLGLFSTSLRPTASLRHPLADHYGRPSFASSCRRLRHFPGPGSTRGRLCEFCSSGGASVLLWRTAVRSCGYASVLIGLDYSGYSLETPSLVMLSKSLYVPPPLVALRCAPTSAAGLPLCAAFMAMSAASCSPCSDGASSWTRLQRRPSPAACIPRRGGCSCFPDFGGHMRAVM